MSFWRTGGEWTEKEKQERTKEKPHERRMTFDTWNRAKSNLRHLIKRSAVLVLALLHRYVLRFHAFCHGGRLFPRRPVHGSRFLRDCTRLRGRNLRETVNNKARSLEILKRSSRGLWPAFDGRVRRDNKSYFCYFAAAKNSLNSKGLIPIIESPIEFWSFIIVVLHDSQVLHVTYSFFL